jgi:arylamine N-acetyltransferase
VQRSNRTLYSGEANQEFAKMGLRQPTYPDIQVEAYLRRIAYTPAATDGRSLVEHLRQRVQSDPLGTLTELQRHHLATIPWGNSGLHYSQHHTISLHPDSLYEKIVERRLDGYCMESTGLFFIVLRSLGYCVYATGGRVSYAVVTGVDNGLWLSM